MIIRAFSDWCYNFRSGLDTDPLIEFQRVFDNDNDELVVSNKLHVILLDLMMYNNSKLIQEALYLLMVYEGQADILLEITDNVQIIYSQKMERVCKEISINLKSIKRLAEMYEIW